VNERHDKGIALWKTIAMVVCLLGLGTATYAVSSLQISAVTPEPNAWLNQREVHIVAKYSGVVGSSAIRVDGRPLETTRNADAQEIVATASGLSDGRHQVEVQASRALGIGEVDRTFEINIDTRPPKVVVETPAAGTIVRDRLLEVSGRTEPGTRLTIRALGKNHKDEVPPFVADADGRFKTRVKVADDRNKIRIDAVDRAGNHGAVVRDIVCDLAAPTVTSVYPAPDAVIKLDPTVTIRASVKETGSGVQRAVLTVDGKAHPFELHPEGGEVVYHAENLPEGTREVVLEVEDKAGWKTRKAWSFLVDTTETFGARPLTRGARGRDVAVLQKRLVKWGDLAADQVTSVLDEATSKAIEQFQAEHHVNVDGVVGFETIGLMSPRIEVDLSTFTLTLYDGGKKVKSYGIACGMPQYPTPTGHFRVAYLEKNPTWIPPHSVWAREAKAIPPGPGNPLGTRWIGLDSDAVGIHGTPASWSIGSRASHGCVRMRIPDVEDLFDRVNPGTRVSIFWGKDSSGM
jgi:hypothetical protein